MTSYILIVLSDLDAGLRLQDERGSTLEEGLGRALRTISRQIRLHNRLRDDGMSERRAQLVQRHSLHHSLQLVTVVTDD